jgi:hypothetical protein
VEGSIHSPTVLDAMTTDDIVAALKSDAGISNLTISNCTCGVAVHVMNMTFTRMDRRRSQLSIEPTCSQIGCEDQELSQLRGYAKIYICRNNQVLSTQIGMRTDRTGTRKASRFSRVWTGSGSEEALAPRKEVLSTQLV